MYFGLVKNLFFILISICLCFVFGQCNDEDEQRYEQNLVIGFRHQIGPNPLTFQSQFFNLENGDSFMPSKLIYHVNNFQLIAEDGSKHSFDNQYFMLNPQSGIVDVNLGTFPNKTFTSIQFDLGVRDSVINSKGELNPLFIDPMYWQMNAGYINFKLEGNSPNSPNEAVILHIGGYKKGQETAQEIQLKFPEKIQGNRGPSKTKMLKINVDLAQLFSGSQSVPLRYFHKIHKPGDSAQIIANNFQFMFNF